MEFFFQKDDVEDFGMNNLTLGNETSDFPDENVISQTQLCECNNKVSEVDVSAYQNYASSILEKANLYNESLGVDKLNIGSQPFKLIDDQKSYKVNYDFVFKWFVKEK